MNPLFIFPFLIVFLLIMTPEMYRLLRPTLRIIGRTLLIFSVIFILFIAPHC